MSRAFPTRPSSDLPRCRNLLLKAITRGGGSFGRHPTTGRVQGRATSGRGAAAARLAGRHLDHRARRVVIKTRLVNLQRAGARSTEKHLRYIERDGITRDGARGQLYGPNIDQADRSEEHTSELQSLMRNSYAVFCLNNNIYIHNRNERTQ